MNNLTRRSDIREIISTVIDKELVLINSEKDLNTLIGVKITLFKHRYSGFPQRKAVEDILERHSSREIKISELDRLRLKYLVLPRFSDTPLIWDSASRKVPFWTAVELFDADLQYLLSEELSEHLPVTCAAARAELLAEIRNSRLHRMFGRGSKVSEKQYGRLVRATEGGWMKHLAEQGIKLESVYELGEPQGHGNALVEDENDLLPWDTAA